MAVSPKEIYNNLITRIKNNPQFSRYMVDGESPLLKLLCHEVSVEFHKAITTVSMYKNECFIQEAISPDSIFNHSKAFGYRINRYTSPKIKVKYIGNIESSDPETKLITPGDIIGKYLEYDIIYIGKKMYIERGDSIICAIGKVFKHTNKQFEILDSKSLVSVDIFPLDRMSIDNDLIFIEVDDGFEDISIDLEDFIIKNSIVDFSIDNVSSRLYVYDYSSLYGKKVDYNTKYNLTWVETDGRVSHIDDKELKIDEIFSYQNTMSNGLDSDNPEDLKSLVPFYYRTMRRVVTDSDYRYILLANPYIKDVSIYSKDLNNKFIFYIHSNTNNYNNITLSEVEKRSIAEYMKRYKMTGVKLYFTPGKPIDLLIDIRVKVVIDKTIKEVKTIIKEIVESYIFKLGNKFDLGEIVQTLSTYQENGVNVFTSILPNKNSTDTLDLLQYEYLVIKDENLKISFI